MGNEETTSDLPAWSRCPHPEAVSTRWGDSITEERQAALQVYLDTWEAETDHGERSGPFDGVSLTGADVFWLSVQTLGKGGDQEYIRWQVGRLLNEVPDLSDLHLEGVSLKDAHLEGASLIWAHLEGAYFTGTHLEFAHLDGIYLNHAFFSDEPHLEGAVLNEAHLEGAVFFGEAHLESAFFTGAHLRAVTLNGAHLEGAGFALADMQSAFLRNAHLEGASFRKAHLEQAFLDGAHLAGATFHHAHLEGARLERTHLEGKRLPSEDVARIRRARVNRLEPDFAAELPPADLRLAYFDNETTLNGTTLGNDEFGYIAAADVRWRDVNLASVNWTRTTHGVLCLGDRVEAIELGDEVEARSATDHKGALKNNIRRLQDYQDAVRTNRQLATVLRQQGLHEDADRFAYKAQTLQREVLRRQGNVGGYAFSLLLWALSGYGYRLWRIAAAYGLVLNPMCGFC